MVLEEVTATGPLVRTFGLVVCHSALVQEPRDQFLVRPKNITPREGDLSWINKIKQLDVGILH